MSPREEVGIHSGNNNYSFLHSKAADFGFLPTDLIKKCGRLIHAHHQAVGYASFPDLLWDEQTRDFIMTYKHLQAVLRNASTTQSAKKPMQPIC